MSQLQERTDEVRSETAAEARAAHRSRLSRFRGTAENAIDDKGRLTIPTTMRKPLMGGAVIAVMEDRAALWDDEAFAAMCDHLALAVRDGDLTSRHLRDFIARTHTVVPDAQGRIVVPHEIRVEVGLDREVCIRGVGAHIELSPLGADDLDDTSIHQSVVDAIDMALF